MPRVNARVFLKRTLPWMSLSRLRRHLSPASTRSTVSMGSVPATAQFQATITKLFRSWQVILQTGQEQYGNDWNTRFKPVFQSLSPAFVTIKSHFASLNIDLAAFLRVTLLDLNLFLAVGIDINVLLGLNLSIGGLLTL
uniref:Differentiation-related protein 2 n=1 Tax=Puccinia striiformis f. sp. tritici TaxID=168172 RepID=G0ZNG9_9BASI|nr:differentiation-related protein 2 [Puccinia striiformis f. sp. tritici]